MSRVFIGCAALNLRRLLFMILKVKKNILSLPSEYMVSKVLCQWRRPHRGRSVVLMSIIMASDSPTIRDHHYRRSRLLCQGLESRPCQTAKSGPIC